MREHIKEAIVSLITLVVVILIGAGAISIGKTIYGKISGNQDAGLIHKEETYHAVEISLKDIRRELSGIAELLTSSYSYSGTASITDQRETLLFKWNIPFTSHKIKLTYAGTIKVGYILDDMVIDIDDRRERITISLGTQVIENNLPEECVETIEDNNIINPIRSDEVTKRLADIKQKELENAKQDGVMDYARERAEEIIRERLSGITDYKVVFRY